MIIDAAASARSKTKIVPYFKELLRVEETTEMRGSISAFLKGRVHFQMLDADSEPFSEGSMGTDLHPYPDGSSDALMDVSQSNTYYMSAPASGPYEYGET